MTQVAIVGIGQTPVAEHWDKSLQELAQDAITQALADADLQTVDALYVGNAYGGTIGEQSHVAPLIADFAGLVGIEAWTVDAGDAAGGAALRAGYLAVASGAVETALVVGVEKMTDRVGSAREGARNTSIHAELENLQGATLTSLAGLLMQRYLHEQNIPLSAFEPLSINAHLNGSSNPYAMYRNKLREGAFAKAPMVSHPVSLFDRAPDGDGAAAVILTRLENAQDMVPTPIRIVGSAVSTDQFAIQDRQHLLKLEAVSRAVDRALSQAQLNLASLSFAELHDAFTILSVLTLEAMGLAEYGKGWEFIANGQSVIGRNGTFPISTMGGLKSRGNPSGATGVYQAVEATLQLRGQAGDNQITNAKTALLLNLGGMATTAIAHILSL